MRNFLGGVLGGILAMILAYLLVGGPSISYPEPFDMLSFLFAGATVLSQTFENFLHLNFLYSLVSIWVLVGLFVAPFAVNKWNLLRTTMWIGIVIASTALVSIMLSEPSFWSQPTRNYELALLYLKSIVAALLSLPTSVVGFELKKRLMKKEPAPIPEGIETVCDCGAIYKSNPMICVECGQKLGETEIRNTE